MANNSSKERNSFETNVAILRDIVQFAYEQGFHELGYDIVDEWLSQVRPAGETRARRISCSRCVQANGCADGECRFAAALPCGCEPGRTPEWIRRKCGCLPNDAGISVCPYCQHVNGGHSLACTVQKSGADPFSDLPVETT